MKICLAQTRPIAGDIVANCSRHLQLIDLAVAHKANCILFPELSLTGYAPTLARALATTPSDSRFAPFQSRSDTHNISIGVGVPLQTAAGITISLLLFQPETERAVYSKQYLHPDEEPFFTSGQNTNGLFNKQGNIALAICYELSVPQHAEDAYSKGATVYLASVAKTAPGVVKAAERLAQIAREHSMSTGMVNSLGLQDGLDCAGGSTVWNNRGELLAQLDNSREGILLFDTATEETLECYL